jgi:malonate decarboxylase beta subunit
MSGPEVIETVRVVEEFDSRDRALVWRVTGGKHRYLLGEVDALVADDMAAFRAAALARLGDAATFSLEAVEAEHRRLTERWTAFSGSDDAIPIWRELGVRAPEKVPLLDAEAFVAMVDECRRTAA